MKNYKHSFTTNNKMKLAAVAASAIMLAPVAMSSVSTFADGGYTTTVSGTPRTVLYPVYNGGSVLSLTEGIEAAKENGTSGNVSSSMDQSATTGFSTADLNAAIAALNAISTSSDKPANGYYTSQKAQLEKANTDAWSAANKLNTQVADNSLNTKNPFMQLSAENQAAYQSYRTEIGEKFAGLHTDASKLKTAYETADTAATNAAVEASKANATDTTKAEAIAKADAANAAATAYANMATSYSAFAKAVTDINTVIARQTNNGSVLQAAETAAKAINNVPAGADKDALTKSYLSAQGAYLIATQATVSQKGDKNSQAIDAAAAVAVKALNDVAGKAFTLAPYSDATANGQIGVVKVNYPAGYGIQIWTAAGKAVRYNQKEADATGHKLGDAKKLPGQKTYKVYAVNGQKTVKMNGTTYYNLGGDQYIDQAYVTPVK